MLKRIYYKLGLNLVDRYISEGKRSKLSKIDNDELFNYFQDFEFEFFNDPEATTNV